MSPHWAAIKEFIIEFGWTKGVFTVFFFSAHYWVYRLYEGRLKDRQAEIDRLAQDNREYRHTLLTLYDKHFGINDEKNDKAPKSLPAASASTIEQQARRNEPTKPRSRKERQ